MNENHSPENFFNVNKTDFEFRFVGMKRSGNHAIINWIIRQSQGPLLHYNNVRPDDPYQGWALTTCTHKESSTVKKIIYSIEDTSLAIIGDEYSYPHNGKYSELNVKQRSDILVLRDPFNLLASRFQRGGEWGKMNTYVSGLSTAQMWVTYAIEFLGLSKWLPYDPVKVNYNLWCKSQIYRKEIAKQLNLKYTDAGYKEVTQYGGGSSFERTRLDGQAQSMKTEERWKIFCNDPSYQNLFRDPLLLELAESIFDLDDDLSAFISHELRPKARRFSSWNRWLATKVTQHIVARSRRFTILRNVHRKFTRKWRHLKMPMPKAK